MPEAMPEIRFDHTVIHVRDWQKANAFYRDVLGAELIRNPEAEDNPLGGWVYRFGGQQLNVHGPWPGKTEPCCPPPLNDPGRADLCFVWPEKIDSAIEHLHRLEVQILSGPISRFGAGGAGASVYCRDPDGNLVELISYSS
jgi:catechol 2,3-dioxygenase-like lactoylglutathione lyase family enzyme